MNEERKVIAMMESIAGSAMDLSASRIAMDYSIAVAKKAMENQEQMGQQILQMMPPPVAKGAYIDTYA